MKERPYLIQIFSRSSACGARGPNCLRYEEIIISRKSKLCIWYNNIVNSTCWQMLESVSHLFCPFSHLQWLIGRMPWKFFPWRQPAYCAYLSFAISYIIIYYNICIYIYITSIHQPHGALSYDWLYYSNVSSLIPAQSSGCKRRLSMFCLGELIRMWDSDSICGIGSKTDIMQ